MICLIVNWFLTIFPVPAPLNSAALDAVCYRKGIGRPTGQSKAKLQVEAGIKAALDGMEFERLVATLWTLGSKEQFFIFR